MDVEYWYHLNSVEREVRARGVLNETDRFIEYGKYELRDVTQCQDVNDADGQYALCVVKLRDFVFIANDACRPGKHTSVLPYIARVNRIYKQKANPKLSKRDGADCLLLDVCYFYRQLEVPDRAFRKNSRIKPQNQPGTRLACTVVSKISLDSWLWCLAFASLSVLHGMS